MWGFISFYCYFNLIWVSLLVQCPFGLWQCNQHYSECQCFSQSALFNSVKHFSRLRLAQAVKIAKSLCYISSAFLKKLVMFLFSFGSFKAKIKVYEKADFQTQNTKVHFYLLGKCQEAHLNMCNKTVGNVNVFICLCISCF